MDVIEVSSSSDKKSELLFIEYKKGEKL